MRVAPIYRQKKDEKKRKKKKRKNLTGKNMQMLILSCLLPLGRVLLKVILRMRPASPSGVRVVIRSECLRREGNTRENKPWRFANGRPRVEKIKKIEEEKSENEERKKKI
jgi:hypothetical protein